VIRQLPVINTIFKTAKDVRPYEGPGYTDTQHKYAPLIHTHPQYITKGTILDNVNIPEDKLTRSKVDHNHDSTYLKLTEPSTDSKSLAGMNAKSFALAQHTHPQYLDISESYDTTNVVIQEYRNLQDTHTIESDPILVGTIHTGYPIIVRAVLLDSTYSGQWGTIKFYNSVGNQVYKKDGDNYIPYEIPLFADGINNIQGDVIQQVCSYSTDDVYSCDGSEAPLVTKLFLTSGISGNTYDVSQVSMYADLGYDYNNYVPISYRAPLSYKPFPTQDTVIMPGTILNHLPGSTQHDTPIIVTVSIDIHVDTPPTEDTVVLTVEGQMNYGVWGHSWDTSRTIYTHEIKATNSGSYTITLTELYSGGFQGAGMTVPMLRVTIPALSNNFKYRRLIIKSEYAS
jgi:hypothetical protein